jgi:sulfonate transport system substrate-binding protein
MKSDSFSIQRRRVLAVSGAATLAGLLPVAAPHVARAGASLPSTVRIAVVARTNAAGQTRFTGASAGVAEQGWLEGELRKLGVALQWVPVTTNSVAVQVNEAFASRTIDFAHYGDLPSVIANASGVRTRLVVPGGGLSNTYLIVPAASSARTIKDLKGKRIALHRGRPWEFPFSRLLAQAGMSNRDVRLLNLNPQAGAAALATGSTDGFFTLSDAFLLEDKKVGKIIWSSKRSPADWKMRAEVWGDAAFLERYPQLAQLVASAWIRVHRSSSADDGFERYIRDEVARGQPESVVRRELAGDDTPWKARWSPLFTSALKAHYAQQAEYARSAGLVAKPLDTSSLYAPQYVAQALVEQKLQGYWNS